MMTAVQFKYSPQSPIQKAQKTSTLLKNVFSENINCPFCVCVCVLNFGTGCNQRFSDETSNIWIMC